MAEHIAKRHNKTLLIYHLVFPVKYRRKVFTDESAQTLKAICLELEQRYELQFLEIGIDIDHAHFLIQTVPNKSVSDMVKLIKSITAKQLFRHHPEVKTELWGGNFWTMGYYANTVGQYGNLAMLTNYVKNQGHKNYTQFHVNSPTLFDGIT